MKYKANYKCDTCHATKQLIWDTERVGRAPGTSDIPIMLICGVRGCNGSHILVDAKKRRITVENI